MTLGALATMQAGLQALGIAHDPSGLAAAASVIAMPGGGPVLK